jgi:putative nucleotidyltransferase with HDIG domain
MGVEVETGLSPAIATLLEEAMRSEQAGQRELARRRYESVLYLLRDGDGPTASGVLRRVARTYIDDGQFDAALDCAAAALAVAEALDEDSEIAHAINMTAIAHWQRGDLESAERLYRDARDVAVRARDERLQAMIAQNLGIIANMRGDLAGALEHYAASLTTYRALGDAGQYVGLVLNNMGMAFAHLEQWEQAQATFDEALRHCESTGDASSRRMVQVNLTSMWIARRNFSRAEELCRAVLPAALSADDQRALGETYKHLGIIARTRGYHDEAERRLTDAYANAMGREDLLLAAETAREQAELYELVGRNRDTLQALSLSHRLFTKLRAERNLADLASHADRLEGRFYDVVRRWARTIESKDQYTLNHCERVADYACALARDVGFDEMTMFWFRMGAVLHDVGKVVVPSEVLNKAGPLTADERMVMERHPAAGAELLRDIDFPWDVLPMVRGHHERWDGTGYPDKLAGDAIPLAARITCVADVFDALTTDRPYRPAFTREQAMTMMRADSGRGLDPDLFDRFERLMARFKPRRHHNEGRSNRDLRRPGLSAN